MVDPSGTSDLSLLRDRLDEVDADIVRLIAERFAVVGSIGTAKEQADGPIRDADRERRVLDAVERVARDRGVSASLVRRIFGEIIEHAVSSQVATLAATAPGGRVRVAFQGIDFAYSYLATNKYLGGLGLEGDPAGYRTFREAAAVLIAGEADLAVLPIENTTAGSINGVYDLLREHELSIVGEETWKVDHCLAGPTHVPLTAITRVLSHPQGLEQSSTFLASLPHWTAVPVGDTAEAMRMVADAGDPSSAAIGSPEAAEAYGLSILRRGVANSDGNFTRFVVLARDPVEVDVRVPCKTSLLLVTGHEEGDLLRCLEILSGSGHSMTKLESRPQPGRPWEYLFFLDFEGNLADPRTEGMLEELRTAAFYLKVLGSYPAKATRAEPQLGTVGLGDAAGRAAGAAGMAGAAGSAGSAGSTAAVDTIEAISGAAPARPSRRSTNYTLVDRATRPDDTVVRVGSLLIGGAGFTVMAGPCSVESAEQIDATARAVRGSGAHVLRGGVFKPRTSPYAFQGLGYEGLDLLAAAGRAAGMPVITEVMAVDQVRRIAAQADILQVGARNMQNFDLLRELGKVDRPVLLKRGLSSTIEEWLSSAEYVLAQGNHQVIMCERGIRTFESATRNTLDLSAVVVLRERTHLPVVVDPSHGTGYRPYVAPMAWAARAAGAHGLLIEVHPDPDAALSDGGQSLTFGQFDHLMAGLRHVSPPR